MHFNIQVDLHPWYSLVPGVFALPFIILYVYTMDKIIESISKGTIGLSDHEVLVKKGV